MKVLSREFDALNPSVLAIDGVGHDDDHLRHLYDLLGES